MCETVNRPTSKAGFMADELYKSYILYSNSDITEEKWIELMNEASNKVNYYKGKFDEEKRKALIAKSIDYWNERKLYEATNPTSTPIYLDSKSRERVLECIKALHSNKSIQNLLHPEGLLEIPISENEQAILLDLQITMPTNETFVLKLKSKLDNYTINRESNEICVNDVKTLGKILPAFQDNYEKFRYYRELAIYSWLLSLVAKKQYGLDNPAIKSNCLVVSTIPKYYTKVYQVTKNDFYRGFTEFAYLIRLIAYYYNKGYRFGNN